MKFSSIIVAIVIVTPQATESANFIRHLRKTPETEQDANTVMRGGKPGRHTVHTNSGVRGLQFSMPVLVGEEDAPGTKSAKGPAPHDMRVAEFSMPALVEEEDAPRTESATGSAPHDMRVAEFSMPVLVEEGDIPGTKSAKGPELHQMRVAEFSMPALVEEGDIPGTKSAKGPPSPPAYSNDSTSLIQAGFDIEVFSLPAIESAPTRSPKARKLYRRRLSEELSIPLEEMEFSVAESEETGSSKARKLSQGATFGRRVEESMPLEAMEFSIAESEETGSSKARKLLH